MRVYKHLISIIILFFVFSMNVYAESCDTNDIKRLKVLANDVEITYVYNDDIFDSDGFKIYDTYKVVINNMTDELYIKETKTNTDLSNYAVIDGVLTIDRMYSGKKTFKVYSKTCDKSLKSLYVTLPKFNYYSTDPNCDGKEKVGVCQKFYDSSNLEYYEFLEIITSYENGDVEEEPTDDNVDKIDNRYISFIKNNYVYIGIGGIVIILLIIVFLVLRHKKRGVLE